MTTPDDDSLQAAITAMQNALGQVRALVSENRGDGLYFAIESELSNSIYNLVTRQANQNAKFPNSVADTAFYS